MRATAVAFLALCALAPHELPAQADDGFSAVFQNVITREESRVLTRRALAGDAAMLVLVHPDPGIPSKAEGARAASESATFRAFGELVDAAFASFLSDP